MRLDIHYIYIDIYIYRYKNDIFVKGDFLMRILRRAASWFAQQSLEIVLSKTYILIDYKTDLHLYYRPNAHSHKQIYQVMCL